MPKIENMLQTMREHEIPEETILKLPMPRIKKPTPKEMVAFIDGMDKILSKEQCIAVMNEQGCHKTNKWSAMFRKWGGIHKDKPYDFPLTYCGCCGAHVKYTHEFVRGVKLRLKEIASSKQIRTGKSHASLFMKSFKITSQYKQTETATRW